MKASALPDPETGYIHNIDEIRAIEYPLLKDTVYLDHAGATPYAKSVIEAHAKDLTTNLFGNPHSASPSSQLASRRIDDVRLKVLRFFNANPEDFDVVFVANATAAIKLVADAFHDGENGFYYTYHVDSHTSLIGVRELATLGHQCFFDDTEARKLIEGHSNRLDGGSHLFAYPAQSNMTGDRLPLDWCKEISKGRKTRSKQIYSLLDAAALVSTAPLDLRDTLSSPDFITVSFYKIFGYPDLGALIVRKDAGQILRSRRYFGGGTVDMVNVQDASWHAKKQGPLYACLEDGTLPFHSIMALQAALDVHVRLYGTMEVVAAHTHYLCTIMHKQLVRLRHGNGQRVCDFYSSSAVRGPVISLNLRDEHGTPVSVSEVEKLAFVRSIQLRTGGLCNPGGVARYLRLTSTEQRRNFDAGHRCGSDNDIIDGRATGVIRVSLGAMSNIGDVLAFIAFIEEFYVKDTPQLQTPTSIPELVSPQQSSFIVESISVFPIKSCAAFKIPHAVLWEVTKWGLAWDREWCLVHQGTGVGLSQKRYPRMALLQPSIDLSQEVLYISHKLESGSEKLLEISLKEVTTPSSSHMPQGEYCTKESSICGEDIDLQIYTSQHIMDFFTEALGVPCTLARHIHHGPSRIAKIPEVAFLSPGRSPLPSTSIRLSNESPILLVSRSSVNRLNEIIKENTGSVGRAVAAASFRANIVVAEELKGGQAESPYVEDDWHSLTVGDASFNVLGPCQRCQMVCIDQVNAKRNQEPFSTLTKTRRKSGKVWFGMHLGMVQDGNVEGTKEIQVGSRVYPSYG